jgi:hypothetical protein
VKSAAAGESPLLHQCLIYAVPLDCKYWRLCGPRTLNINNECALSSVAAAPPAQLEYVLAAFCVPMQGKTQILQVSSSITRGGLSRVNEQAMLEQYIVNISEADAQGRTSLACRPDYNIRQHADLLCGLLPRSRMDGIGTTNLVPVRVEATIYAQKDHGLCIRCQSNRSFLRTSISITMEL